MRLAVRIMRLIGKDPTRFGRNQDINLEQLAGDQDYPRHVSINFAKVAEKQQQATCAMPANWISGSKARACSNGPGCFPAKRIILCRPTLPVAKNYHAHGLFDGV